MNSVMGRHWYTGAFWKTTELSSNWIQSPLFHLYVSFIPLCFVFIDFQEIFCPHLFHLEGILSDSHYFPPLATSLLAKRLHFQPPAVDKTMWLVLANGLDGSRSLICYYWVKAFKSQCVSSHVFSPSRVKHLLKWKCHKWKQLQHGGWNKK